MSAKNTAAMSHYSLIYYNSSSDEVSYYRLKMVDFDGLFNYSKVVTVNNDVVKNISVSPNPASSDIVVKHSKAFNSTLVKIISASGHVISTGVIEKMPHLLN